MPFSVCPLNNSCRGKICGGNMEKNEAIVAAPQASTAHVLFYPFSAQGHINPAFQFAKRLVSKGLKATVAITVHLSKTVHIIPGEVNVEIVSDGFDETGPVGAETGDIFLSRFKVEGSKSLTQLIKKHEKTCYPITCLVFDSVCPWALDVAKEFGLVGAIFFTQACAVCSIYYHANTGLLPVPVTETPVSLPSLPPLNLSDLPATVCNLDEPLAHQLLKDQFSNVEKADWLLFNSFDKLETDVLMMMKELWQVKAIGPTTPSMYLDKRVEDDTGYNLNLFKPNDDVSYTKWLNAKEKGSVVYISFGSIVELGEEEMEEIVWGIRQSNKSFLWVVREKEQNKLPKNFSENLLDNGLMVSWCSQLEVLSHQAIGCFLSHCGWNSIMEALSLGVPVVAVPRLWDQPMNGKLVEMWGMGVRVKMDEKGMVRREELELCIRDVMEGEKEKVMKKNASKLRELAKEAMNIGGSSDKNIDEFVASLVCAKI